MVINIQVRHDAAGDGIKKYITQEFQKLQDKYDMISADFIVDQEGSNGHVKLFEAIVHVSHDTFTVKESADEPHKSVDAAMRTLEKLLVKHKETYSRPGAKIRHNTEKATAEDV